MNTHWCPCTFSNSDQILDFSNRMRRRCMESIKPSRFSFGILIFISKSYDDILPVTKIFLAQHNNSSNNNDTIFIWYDRSCLCIHAFTCWILYICEISKFYYFTTVTNVHSPMYLLSVREFEYECVYGQN